MTEERRCDCGEPIGKYYAACGRCLERRKLIKCKVVEWDGSCMVWIDDQYWSSPDAVLESFEDDESSPAYVHPSEFVTFQLNLEQMLEEAGEEHHEEIHSQYDVSEVEAAIKRFNETTRAGSWFADTSRVIVLDQERFERILEGGE